MLLSGRLYCCSSQRKSRGERIISQLIPTLLISHHSLPQPLIYRRVNFFSLFSLFWVTNSLFPLLLLFRIARHYRHSFPKGIEREAERGRTLAVKFPREGGGTITTSPSAPPHPPPPLQPEKTEADGEGSKRNKLSSPHCTTPWELKINKAVCVCAAIVGVAAGIGVNTLKM